MIIDIVTPDQHDVSLTPWQSGVINDVIDCVHTLKSGVKLDKNPMKSVNMGRSAGHSHLARIFALSNFPVRTKVYTTTINAAEFSDLVLKSHELVDILYDADFAGYHGDPVDLVVVDMANQPIAKYQTSLDTLVKSLPITTMILLLQPAITSDSHKMSTANFSSFLLSSPANVYNDRSHDRE